MNETGLAHRQQHPAPAPTSSPGIRTDRATIVSWGLWDMGSAAFNAVLVTFVFSVYLTDSVGLNIHTSAPPSTWYSLAIALSGVAIAMVAPVMGQRADARGQRRRSVRVWTLATFALMMALFFIRNDGPGYFWAGITIMAIASVTFAMSEVSYYAMINQVSTRDNVGQVSGFGWSLGYFGGIILLLLCYVGFISGSAGGQAGLLGISTDGGLNIRLVAVIAALWFLFLGLPVMFKVPEIPANPAMETGGLKSSYKHLFATLKHLWVADRNTLWFLLASAVFRDGLAGVFTFGAILAVSVYGFAADQVLLFGVAANVISAIGALACGRFDDKYGPKPVIAVSLACMVIVSAVLYVVSGTTMFWIFGLALCLFVGPAQSASRTFLSRLASGGNEGQLFGLYATTGRAVSPLAPALFSLFTGITGQDRTGILAIGLILVAGLVMMIPVKQPR